MNPIGFTGLYKNVHPIGQAASDRENTLTSTPNGNYSQDAGLELDFLCPIWAGEAFGSPEGG
jgi:hypothetical protein